MSAAAFELLFCYAPLLLLAVGSLFAPRLLERTDLRLALPAVRIGTFATVLLLDAREAHMGWLVVPTAGCVWMFVASCWLPRDDHHGLVGDDATWDGPSPSRDSTFRRAVLLLRTCPVRRRPCSLSRPPHQSARPHNLP